VRVAVFVPGKFQPGFLWARYLAEHESLHHLVSPMPYSRIARFDVPQERVVCLSPIGIANTAMFRYGPSLLQPMTQLAISEVFDRAAARYLEGSDVLNGWSSTSLRSIRAARKRGIPSVLQVGSAHIAWQHDRLSAEHRRLGLRQPHTHPRVIERAIAEYSEADVIVVPSQFVWRTFLEMGISETKLRLVHETALPRVSTAAIPRRSDERPRILFAGRCEPQKGVHHLIEAFGQLHAPATLRLVGPMDRAFRRRLGLFPSGVEHVGRLDGEALAAEFQSADIFALPSIQDGFAMATVEAMAAGLPVIVSANAGSSEVVEEGVSGFIVPAGDIDALVDRLELLASDASLRKRMGAAARGAAAERTWQRYGKELEDTVYRPLLKGHGA
jgi:glycosyltransferase involved in cell wall biosynthesis